MNNHDYTYRIQVMVLMCAVALMLCLGEVSVASQHKVSAKSPSRYARILAMTPEQYSRVYANVHGNDTPGNADYANAFYDYARRMHARTTWRAHKLLPAQRQEYTRASQALTSWHVAYVRWKIQFDLGGTYWTRPMADQEVELEQVISEIETGLAKHPGKVMSRSHVHNLKLLSQSIVQETKQHNREAVYYDSEKPKYAGKTRRFTSTSRALGYSFNKLPDSLYVPIVEFIKADIETVRQCME